MSAGGAAATSTGSNDNAADAVAAAESSGGLDTATSGDDDTPLDPIGADEKRGHSVNKLPNQNWSTL